MGGRKVALRWRWDVPTVCWTRQEQQPGVVLQFDVSSAVMGYSSAKGVHTFKMSK
jgi:hypothetical protein